MMTRLLFMLICVFKKKKKRTASETYWQPARVKREPFGFY
jgi:hypothetical protein